MPRGCSLSCSQPVWRSFRTSAGLLVRLVHVRLRRASYCASVSLRWRAGQVLEAEVSHGSPETLPAVLRGLPWLLGHFCAAARRARRPAAAERGALAAAPPAADFDFFAALLRPLLARMAAAQLADAGVEPGGGPAAQAAAAGDGGAAAAAAAEPGAPSGKRKRRRAAGAGPAGEPAGKRARAAAAERGAEGAQAGGARARLRRWVVVAEGAAALVAALATTGAPRLEKGRLHAYVPTLA